MGLKEEEEWAAKAFKDDLIQFLELLVIGAGELACLPLDNFWSVAAALALLVVYWLIFIGNEEVK